MFVKLKRFCHDSFSATWLNAFSYSTSSSCDLCATAAVKMSHSPTCWREKKTGSVTVQSDRHAASIRTVLQSSGSHYPTVCRCAAGVRRVTAVVDVSPNFSLHFLNQSWGVFYKTCSQIYISISFKDDFRRCAFVQFIQDAEREIPVCQITHLWSINLQST